VFFSYIGFDSVTTLAGEVRRPSRDLPIGIVGTLLIATSLYIGVSIVICGMLSYVDLENGLNAPLAYAFRYRHNKWAAIIISVGGVTALVASTLCSLLGQPRIYFQMAKDGLLPKRFGTVSEKTQAPVFGTIATGVSASILAVLLDLNTLADMISIGTLLAFTVVCGGVIVMRCRTLDGATPPPTNRFEMIPVPLLLFLFFIDAVGVSFLVKFDEEWWTIFITAMPLLVIFVILAIRPQPGRPSTFTCPFVPLVPLVGILVNTFLIIQLNIDSIYRVIGWTAIGMAIYFGYGIRHSRLNYANPKGGSINDIKGDI
jgi:APA family basic amino acid/polyamine antiporter